MPQELELGRLVAEIALENRPLINAAEESERVFEDLDQSSQKVVNATGKMSEGFTVAKGAIASFIGNGLTKLSSKLLDVGRDILRTGEQFTSSMSEVQAISGATSDELKQLEKTAREYGATTKFSATETADALKYMSLAGWDVQQSTSALGGILDLAAASGMGLAQASDMVTDYLSAFRMQAKQSYYMADLLTYAQGNSNTSAAQLGEAYYNCAANMNAAGQDIETVTSFLEAMANQGLKGSEAGTTLSAVIRDLTAKMKDGKITIGKTAIAVQDEAGNFRDLTNILSDVEKAVNGMGTAQQSAALKSVFSDEAIKGVNLSLGEGINKISGYETALRNSSGAAAGAAKTMSDNLSGDIKTLDSTLDELKLKIFSDAEQPIRGLVQTITTKGVPAFGQLISNIDKLIPIVVSAASAMGAYKASLGILSIIQGLQQGYAVLTAKKAADTAATVAQTSATNAATAAQTGLNTVMAANPIGLVVAAIGLLVGGLTTYALIANHSADVSDNLNQSIQNIQKTANESIGDVEGQAGVISALGERYNELRVKTNKTKSDYQELSVVAEQLADKLELTTDQIREQNGEYKDLIPLIEKTTSQMMNQAKSEAAQTALTEAYKTQYEAKKQYENKLQSLVEQGIYWYDEHGKAVTDSSKITSNDILNECGELTNLGKAYENAVNTVDYYTKELTSVNAEIANNTSQTTIATAAANSNTDAVNQNAEAYTEQRKAIELSQHAQENYIKALDSVNAAESMLSRVEQESAENHKISLSTLSELARKYPQLADVVEDYISGLKSEKDVIESLTSVYENDVSNYNFATKAKVITSSSFYENMLKNNSNLVNDMKSKYDIDLSNYQTLQQAKAATSAAAQAKIRSELLKTAYQEYIASDTSVGNFGDRTRLLRANILGESDSFYASTLRNSPQALRFAEEINQADYIAAQAGDKVAKEINDIANRYYSGLRNAVSSDAIRKFETGKSSGKSVSSNNQKSAIQQYIDYLDDLKELDKLSLESEIASYEWALSKYSATADEKHDIDVRLYNARKKLREQQEAEEKKKRDNEIAALDKLGDAVVQAIKNKYEQQKKLEESRIDESIAGWKKWEDETCSAIKGQIDALDELRNAHEEESKREEYENKRQGLELKARYEKDEYNRKQIKKEIADLDKEENERLYHLQIEEQKKVLEEQAENIKIIASERQQLLQDKKTEMSAKYQDLTTDIALQGEMQKYLTTHSRSEIEQLINDYAPTVEMLGTSLGERIYSGISRSVRDVVSFVDEISRNTDTASERNRASSALSGFLSTYQSTISDYKKRIAYTANAAANRFYQTQQHFNSTLSDAQRSSNLYFTVNFNDKVDSPLKVKRQLESVANQLAQQIS